MYPCGVFVSQDWDDNVKLVFKIWPMSILVMMHYVCNMMIHFKHIEILLFRECIILIPFCLILSKTYLMGDVSWIGWLTPKVLHLGQQQ